MPCVLSAIVAQTDAAARLSRAVAALDRACTNLHAEIIVVQNPDVPSARLGHSRTPLTVMRAPTPALVPQLWARGLAVARGEYVAFSLANCEVSEGWATAMIEGLQHGVGGVGGPIGCAPEATGLDRAIYYLRYSAFLPSRVADGVVCGEIAGDNAAYSRAALLERADLLNDGFWEFLYHERVRQAGERLTMRRAARAQFTGGCRLSTALRHRFAHGRHFGATRVADRTRRPWQIALGAPLVPFLLATRAASRVVPSAVDRWRFLGALPLFVTIASAWAIGEAVGAMRGAGLPNVGAGNTDHEGTERASATEAAAPLQS